MDGIEEKKTSPRPSPIPKASDGSSQPEEEESLRRRYKKLVCAAAH